uniref:Golgin subfamily B member 1 n=2 Tax=Lygus hesperus TaxID=30085 RepID=A0A0A9ZB70_LYGHE
MLKELYEKESGKNEQFYADLMGLESEMSQSKSDLINRLEEVTSILQGRENYIEILEQDIVNMKSKMFSIESGMDDRHRELKDRAQMMISKLEEAEMMTSTFDKYKVEVEKRITALQDSEAKLKDQLINAQVQLEESQEEASAAKLRNSILEKEKYELECQVNGMQPELQTLRDIRSAYNNTLDEIEKLNGGLKEAMEGFEAKSEKLNLLESEREVLINKLTDLEDAFGDLEKKLEESDGMNMSFRSQVEVLSRQLEESKIKFNESQQELNNIRLSQAGNDLLKKEMSELTGSYEEKIRVLVTSKEKLEELLFNKGNEVMFLQSNLVQMEEELQRVRQGYESRINAMEAASHQQLQSVRQSQQENAAAGRAEEAPRVQVEPLVQSIQTSPLHANVRRLASGDSMENPFADIKDEEDGWGWMGAENVMPEVEAAQPQESSRISELTNTVQQLEIERDTAVQQLEAMKVNYRKVLKKLKDMKAEQAKVETTKGGFSDLDLVLQEELRSENDALRAKMGELSKQFESLKKEKEMLTKRVDTLTSANEQLVDMKERQDIEVQMWQKRSSELSNQVQNLQWSLDALRSENPSANDPELSLKLIALGAENDELKGVLLGKKEEINQANAREQDLEQEIQDLKECLSKLELAVANAEKPVESTEATPITSAAVLFQSTPSDPELLMKLDTLSAENDKLKKELLQKKEEMNQALEDHRAREYSFQLEIQNLQGSLRNLEKTLADVEKSVVKETTPVATAAVLFQGTATAFDDVLSWHQPSVPQSVESPAASIEELTKQKAILEAEVSRIQREFESLRSDKDQLEHRVTYLWQQNSELLQRIDEQNAFPDEEQGKKVHELEKQVASQKAYYDEQVKELEENFQKALLERDEDNAHLVCTISAKEQALKNATQELQSLRDQYKNVAELHDKLQEYQKENGNLKSEVEALRNYLDVSRESSESEHSSTIQTLKNQNLALEEANLRVKGLLNEKEEQLQALIQTVREKEAEIQACQEKLEQFTRQIDDLKSGRSEDAITSSQVLAEIESLSGTVADYEITIKNQLEQLSDKDRIIVELQNEIRCLQSVSESTRYDFGDGEETLRSDIGFLEQERLRLEGMVQERLSEVAKYEVEIEELKKARSKPQKEDVATYLAMIEEKDGEINRLTKAVVDIQERLLLSEQGKLHPDLRSVQSKLDQALYHLHSRDVKIEELTMEIIQLLEERDSLQFRLSDALRRSAEPSKENLPKSPMQDKTNTEKLSELHGGYKKDPVVQTEREARHVQHMQLYSEDASANKDDSTVDYGIFNWFFGGSSSPATQVDVNDGS